MTPLPSHVEYPIFVIGDLHGQLGYLDNLMVKLLHRPEWPTARLVFLGDLVDRGPDVKGTVQRVIELIAEKPGSTCIMGNHDLALVGALGLGGEPEEYWQVRYADRYDHDMTFQSYLGRLASYSGYAGWMTDYADLKEAMPESHREFLVGLPWVAEAEGHIFVHNGLSPELDAPATTQLQLLHRKIWTRDAVLPKLGSTTDKEFTEHYPVWLGADKKLTPNPLPYPGKVQVTGHVRVNQPEVNSVRIRIDTTGGTIEPLTACLLSSATAEPEFIFSSEKRGFWAMN